MISLVCHDVLLTRLLDNSNKFRVSYIALFGDSLTKEYVICFLSSYYYLISMSYFLVGL